MHAVPVSVGGPCWALGSHAANANILLLLLYRVNQVFRVLMFLRPAKGGSSFFSGRLNFLDLGRLFGGRWYAFLGPHPCRGRRAERRPGDDLKLISPKLGSRLPYSSKRMD